MSIRVQPWLPCLAFLLAIAGCSSPTETKQLSPEGDAATIDLDQLTQHWVHSYEEDGDAGDGQVYRPSGSWEFPPSRFRMAYVFHAGGDLEWMYLAPDDGHHLKTGSWKLDPPESPSIYLQADGPHLLQILELTKDLLRVREVPIR